MKRFIQGWIQDFWGGKGGWGRFLKLTTFFSRFSMKMKHFGLKGGLLESPEPPLNPPVNIQGSGEPSGLGVYLDLTRVWGSWENDYF